MKRLVILASVVALAGSSAACSRDNVNSGEGSSSVTLAPSALGESAALDAKGGGKGGGKPGGTSGSSTLTLVMSADTNKDGLPNWGDTVTFNVSTTETTEPTVELLCSQSGVAVYGATAGFYDSYPWPWTKYMTLSSTAWQGGAAECTATLFPLGARSVVLATVKFNAGS